MMRQIEGSQNEKTKAILSEPIMIMTETQTLSTGKVCFLKSNPETFCATVAKSSRKKPEQ